MSGIVVAPQPRACDLGAGVLSAGGNAFDAAVERATRIARAERGSALRKVF